LSEATSITAATLIVADEVTGTNVHNLAGDEFDIVDDIMIDIVSGRAVYAVMSFGGFLGMGEKYHPLRWATLNCDMQRGGYVVDLDKRLLEGALNYDRRSEFEWTPGYGRKIESYYKVTKVLGVSCNLALVIRVAVAHPTCSREQQQKERQRHEQRSYRRRGQAGQGRRERSDRQGPR
jgi:hypothetical protein